jgi:hypothetical protein
MSVQQNAPDLNNNGPQNKEQQYAAYVAIGGRLGYMEWQDQGFCDSNLLPGNFDYAVYNLDKLPEEFTLTDIKQTFFKQQEDHRCSLYMLGWLLLNKRCGFLKYIEIDDVFVKLYVKI